MFDELKRELKAYYETKSFRRVSRPFNPLLDAMEAWAASHPEASALEQKVAQYEIIADGFTPVLFPHNPFFFETGLKMSEYDGCCENSSGGWVLIRNRHKYRDANPQAHAEYCAASALGLHLAYGPYCDYDHHCFPFTRVLKLGLKGCYAELEAGEEANGNPETAPFYAAAKHSLMLVRKIAARFAEQAEAELATVTDDVTKKYYARIAERARVIPWEPPATFYDGLEMLWFFHELGGVMDGVGMSVMGSPDRQLIELYRNDLAMGRLTPAEAKELVCRYLVQTDCKLDFDSKTSDQFNGGEQGDTLMLGGVDENGKDVTNELTWLFLECHRELGLVYPKIHLRVHAGTPTELVDYAAGDFLMGRNVHDFINDDVIIPAQVGFGKDLRDVVNYVAGGCWEVIVDSCEHSEGANNYFSLGKVMDLSIHDVPEEEARLGMKFKKLGNEENFEEIYQTVMGNATLAMDRMLETITKYGSQWPVVNPCPFFSACLEGCAQSGLDYSAGGARYSPHGVPLTGVAVMVNSLIALKKLDAQQVLAAVRDNWEGHESLRRQAIGLPHFGCESPEVLELTNRLLNDLTDVIAKHKNERGGRYQPGLYSYIDIWQWAPVTRATPDGRRQGDYLTQGITPSRFHDDTVTGVLNGLSGLPLDCFPANSTLSLAVSGDGMDASQFGSIVRSWCQLKSSAMLMLNCVTREQLEDAMKHPENHGSLLVRLCGYSAKFVSLDESRQKEFVSRAILGH